MSEKKKTNVWSVIIKVVIAIATTIAGVLGSSACAF